MNRAVLTSLVCSAPARCESVQALGIHRPDRPLRSTASCDRVGWASDELDTGSALKGRRAREQRSEICHRPASSVYEVPPIVSPGRGPSSSARSRGLSKSSMSSTSSRTCSEGAVFTTRHSPTTQWAKTIKVVGIAQLACREAVSIDSLRGGLCGTGGILRLLQSWGTGRRTASCPRPKHTRTTSVRRWSRSSVGTGDEDKCAGIVPYRGTLSRFVLQERA